MNKIYRRKHLFLLFTLALIFALIITACGDDDGDDQESSEDDAAEQTSPLVIGLSVSTLGNPFFVELQAGAETAAEQHDVTLIVEDAQDDAAQQNTQIQSLIEQGVNALLINPVDGEAVVEAIEAANEAGIPVFTIDRSAAGGTIVSHIASDNAAGGAMAANHLAEVIGRSGNVVELQGIPGTSAAQARGDGFNEAIAAYEDITVIARETANFNRDEGQTVFAALLEEYDAIDGVFAHNDEMILGAIEAAKEAERAGDITFVGFDAIEDALTAIEAGELQATIAQQPKEMGRLGVETAVKHLNGETVADEIPVDLALIQ